MSDTTLTLEQRDEARRLCAAGAVILDNLQWGENGRAFRDKANAIRALLDALTAAESEVARLRTELAGANARAERLARERDEAEAQVCGLRTTGGCQNADEAEGMRRDALLFFMDGFSTADAAKAECARRLGLLLEATKDAEATPCR